MYSRAIHLDSVVLSYDVQGHGSRALLLFHGAGQDRTIFHRLPEALKVTYRLYAFDLFFHGQSQWPTADPITKDDWKNLLQRFCDDEQIGAWDVLGYSIGARFALATVEAFPERTRNCFLVAPDGISTSPWYSLATATSIGRYIFKHCLTSPSLLPDGLSIGVKIRVLDLEGARFIEHQLNTAQKRDRIYRMWTTFRKLRFRKSVLVRELNDHQIAVHAYLGTRDVMIRPGPIARFLKRLKSAHLELIDTNHRRILTEALERIARA